MSHLIHTDPMPVEETPYTVETIFQVLGPLITESRKAKIEAVIEQRSCTVVPVLEGLYDRGNVSAVLRSAEALGYENVHVIESSEQFKQANRVTQGAEKWLDVLTWPDTPSCVQHLQAQGYRVLATCFEDATPLPEIDFTVPTALVFGNEKEGVSPELLEMADGRAVLPMGGFSQSFNISVAAALCLYHIQQDRIRRQGYHGDLDPEEKRRLRAAYYVRSVPLAARILTHHALRP